MGNQGSQGSFTKKNEINTTVNFIHSSSGQVQNPQNQPKEDNKDSDVWQTFTWNYGGNVVLLTDFSSLEAGIRIFRHYCTIYNIKSLPRGIHQYKFIVDGQWRFSPDDPITPDTNGNINNVINTTNFKKMIQKPTTSENAKQDTATDRQTSVQGVQQFAKYAPKLPPHFQTCSFLKTRIKNSSPDTKKMNMQDQNGIFQQSLTETQIQELFSTTHCLPPPYHVEVDHLIRQTNTDYSAYCITQRFKNKYTTYKYFMTEKQG